MNYSFLRVEHVLHREELPFSVPLEDNICPDEGSLKVFAVRPASGPLLDRQRYSA
jgi:hypothetical protein